MVANRARRKRKAAYQAGTYKKIARRGNGRNAPRGYFGRFQMYSGETRFFDGTSATADVSDTGDIVQDSLNHVAAGTGESNRVGRKITLTNIMLQGKVLLPTATSISNASDRIRVIVYLDKHANGATATVTDILEAADVDSFRNLVNSERFTMLYNKTFTLNGAVAGNGTAVDVAAEYKTMKFYKKCNIPVQFSSTTGAMAEIQGNNIGVLAISEEDNARFGFRWRIRFKEN